MPNSCKFRIYQGPQNGAQFELSKGEYVLGSGDEADLIFSDEKMAPMHASLNIDDNCNVTVIPKDGDCYFNDELIAEPALLTSEIFCKLGATVLALKGDGKWPDYDAYIEQKLQSLKADLKQNEKADAGIHSEDKNEASANENISYERKSFFISKSWSIFLALLLIVLLLALIIGPKFFRENPQNADFLAVQKVLDAGNYDIALRSENGALALYGTVSSQERLTELLSSLPEITSSLVMHLDVRDAYLLGIERTLKIMGFDARLSYKENRSLEVSAYMKDPYVEARVLTALAEQYHHDFKSHVVYADQIEPLLRKKLHKASLDSLGFSFTDGAIFYNGDMTLKEIRDLALIEKDLSESLGIPLKFYSTKEMAKAMIETISADPKDANTETVLSPADAVGKADAAKEPLVIDDIMGVTIEPLRFVTLRNGHKYFEGGLLPSGYTISRIDIHKIEVKKGDDVREYKLR